MILADLGWNNFFQKHTEPLLTEGTDVGRVAEQHRTEYVLFSSQGELRAAVAGKIRLMAAGKGDFPVVGDWVVMEPRPGESFARITAILPRMTWFSRKAAGTETEEQVLAANIDTTFWVTSLNSEFNPRRVERYLAAVGESGAQPAVILNKADLGTPRDIERITRELVSIAPRVPIHVLSAMRREGFETLAPYITRGRTVVFLGMSGVGKSSIVNVLAEKPIQEVTEIRKSDDRGRHTTAARQLLLLPGGGMVIDTPGIRELQLWGNTESFTVSFGDIESLAEDCRFADCRHETEPGCAVREAVEDGRLDLKHYGNYLKLRRELARLGSQKDVRSRIVEKRRQRQFGRMVKEMKKNSPKR
ncbi:ribosome small subunit-dependent GTPase A [Candidatus Latescibacterota bacterium]